MTAKEARGYTALGKETDPVGAMDMTLAKRPTEVHLEPEEFKKNVMVAQSADPQ